MARAERDRRQLWVQYLLIAAMAVLLARSLIDEGDWIRVVGLIVVGGATVWWSIRRHAPGLERVRDRAWAAEGLAQPVVWREHRI